MFYTVYKITNLLNGKIYIGCHRTKNINDRYMGSGTAIRLAIQKYGKENFSKEVLYLCNDAGEMLDMEAALVDEAFIEREDTYNIVSGGGIKLEPAPIDAETRKKLSEAGINRYKRGEPVPFKGKKHKPEIIEKIRAAAKESQKGNKNSRFGTKWIHHLEKRQSKSVKADEIDLYLAEGWLLGRKQNW